MVNEFKNHVDTKYKIKNNFLLGLIRTVHLMGQTEKKELWHNREETSYGVKLFLKIQRVTWTFKMSNAYHQNIY